MRLARPPGYIYLKKKKLKIVKVTEMGRYVAPFILSPS